MDHQFADFFDIRPALHNLSTTAAYFCYGSDDYLFFTTKFPADAKRFHLTGAPRCALWGPDGDLFYARDVTRIRERYGSVVLFTSSGGFRHERYADESASAYLIDAWSGSAARHFCAIARDVATSSPETSVIIRPHPGDSWLQWRDLTAGLPNLYVEAAFDLSAWTRAASVVVHPGTSTAAFEAVCSGTPALSTTSNTVRNVASELSYTAPTAQAVLEYQRASVGKGLAAVPSTTAGALLKRKLHYPLEGAAQRVADVLLHTFDFAGPSGMVKPKWRSNYLSKFNQRPQGSALARNTPPPFKRDPLTRARVEEDVAVAQSLLQHNTQVAIHQIEPNCFSIRGA